MFDRILTSRLRNQGRKEMICLTTHSTHFIYVYMASKLRNQMLINDCAITKHLTLLLEGCFVLRPTAVVVAVVYFVFWPNRPVAK